MSRPERLALLDRANHELPMRTQADLLSLNRSSLYYVPVPPSPEEVALKHRIDELYTDRPFYGVRRMTAQLRRDGLLINHKAVERHMREMGLAGVCPGPKLSKPAPGHTVYPYLLRGVTAARPNEVWGIDITYIRLLHGWMYLVVVVDWFARYIVSWELDQTLQQPFVTAAVQRALTVATPGIWNSDQGSHFTSPHSTALLEAAGVRISMDGRGRALDNVFNERLWRTIKYEEVYLNEYSSPREARLRLGHYITFYNHERVHQALAYRTPAEVYDQKGVASTLKLASSVS
jgi:putative transposase